MLVGLCALCRHHRWIVSGRGSRFLFCDRSKSDPAYAKYPPLPVFDCPGFERDAEAAADTPGEAGADAPGGPGIADDDTTDREPTR